MNNSIRLVERVRMTTPNKSKEQTAKALGMQTSNLRRIYKAKGYPNALHCAEIAKITGIPLGDVITYVAADKTRSDETRELIRQRLPRLLPTTGFAIACIVGGMTLLGTDRAQVGELAQIDTNQVRIIDSKVKYLRKLALTAQALLLNFRSYLGARAFAIAA